MSSSEELFQYEDKSGNSFKPLSQKAEDVDDNCSVIPRDMYGLYGVHVSNLPEDISEKELNRTFSVVGKVAVCKLMESRPRRTSHVDSHSLAYAFVKFASSKEAHTALSQFNGYTLNGSILAVRPAYMSERIRRRPSPNVKHHDGDKSSEEGSKKSNENKKEGSQRVTYVMSSSDCRLKDGRLHNSDVMLFNGTSVKSSPPKKVNENRALAPRFRKDSSLKSLESKASHDSHSFQGVPSTSRSELPPVPIVSRQNTTVHQNAVSDFQTSPDNFPNNTDASISASTSAFRPYQGTSGTSNQAAGMQKPVSMENGMATVASTFSHIRLSPLNHSVMENKNAPTWNHSEESDVHSWRQDGVQGSSSLSPPGGTTVLSWSNGRDKPIVSPDRTKSMEQWNSQPRASVSLWSTADVVQFFYNSDCAEYAGFFQEQEIDGRALMLLNRDTLLHFMKVGPALKVLQLIDELRAYGPPPVTHSGNW